VIACAVAAHTSGGPAGPRAGRRRRQRRRRQRRRRQRQPVVHAGYMAPL